MKPFNRKTLPFLAAVVLLTAAPLTHTVASAATPTAPPLPFPNFNPDPDSYFNDNDDESVPPTGEEEQTSTTAAHFYVDTKGWGLATDKPWNPVMEDPDTWEPPRVPKTVTVTATTGNPRVLAVCKTNPDFSSEDMQTLDGLDVYCIAQETADITATVQYGTHTTVNTVSYTKPPLAGNPKNYKLALSKKYRIRSCKPIRVKVNFGAKEYQTPATDMTVVKYALSEVSKASGITLKYVGKTRFTPTFRYGLRPKNDKGLTVALVPPGKAKQRKAGYTDAFDSNYTAGWGGPNGSNGAIIGGIAMYNRTAIGESPVLMTHVLMHEIGHAMGLDHPPQQDSAEVMMSGGTSFTWGRGDLAGFDKVVAANC